MNINYSKGDVYMLLEILNIIETSLNIILAIFTIAALIYKLFRSLKKSKKLKHNNKYNNGSRKRLLFCIEKEP